MKKACNRSRKLRNPFQSAWGVVALAAMSALVLVAGEADAAKVTTIGFKGTENPSVVEIRSDGPLTYEKRENSEDRQVVIELKGASMSRMALRKIDTSSFDSNVLMISPYVVEGSSDTARVVIQLRKAVSADVSQDGNVIRIRVPGPGKGAAHGKSGENAETLDSVTASAAAAEDSESMPSAVTSTPDSAVEAATVYKKNKVELIDESDTSIGGNRLREFERNRKANAFKGRPITLQVRDMEAADVFRMIGEASGFNIILSENVKGKVTLSLVDVPWDQALDVVLQTLGLGADRNRNILRIMPMSALTEEKLAELRATQLAKATTPRVTRIFPVNYAKIEDLARIITQVQASFDANSGEDAIRLLGSGGSSAAGAGSSGGTPRGEGHAVVIDSRTNRLIVRDLPDNLDRVEKLLAVLDTQTPQVLIEGKVVEASELASRNISGAFGTEVVGRPEAALAWSGGIPSSAVGLLGTVSGASGSIGDSALGAVGFSFVPSGARLSSYLTMLESESKLKLISSPKTVVLNREKASITQSFPIAVPITTVASGAAVTSFDIKEGKLSMDVTPTVTDDGAVRLDLDLRRDIPDNAGNNVTAVAQRNIKTQVVVDSGTALVVGGIYVVSDTDSEKGIPFFRKLPLIGTLFSATKKSVERRELLFFITPTVLNAKRAGVSQGGS